MFKTPVSLSTSTNTTKPGSQVAIEVQTKPNAYVALLGIDQSVLLLKSGNDITQDDVMSELSSYEGGQSNEGSNWRGGGRWFRPFFWSGSANAGEIFDDCGVIVLTNGYVQRKMHTSK